MSNVLDQWLGDSISAIEMLEREMNEHHEVIQQAMSTIRRHTTAVERLEVHIEVIRAAASQIESAVEEKRFDQAFDSSYGDSWDVERVEAAEEPAPDRVDEGAGTPVLQLMAAQPGAVTADSVAGPTSTPVAAGSGRSRLPPPPPSAATRR